MRSKLFISSVLISAGLTLPVAALGPTAGDPLSLGPNGEPLAPRGAGRGVSPPVDWLEPLRIEPEVQRFARLAAPRSLPETSRLRLLSQALLSHPQTALREITGPTPTANEAFYQRRADCVGFALLFVALAREVEVPAFFAVVEDFGETRQRGALRVAENHLVAAYGPPETLRIFDFAGEAIGDGTRLRPITDLAAIAIYHSNRGVEALIDGDGPRAAHWLRRAVELDPDLVTAWINLGVAERRTGDLAAARRAYKRALELDPSAESAYQNLAVLFLSSGRPGEADEIRAYAAELRRSDALGYLRQARQRLDRGDLAAARGFYEKALELSRQGKVEAPRRPPLE